MSTSRFTARTFWQEAVVDLAVPTFIENDKLGLVNSAIDGVFQIIHPLLGNSFLRAVRILGNTHGKYSTATGSFDPATAILTMTSISWGVKDRDREINMRVGTHIYVCYVKRWVSVSSVSLYGETLPTVNVTVDSVTVANTIPDSSIVVIKDSIRINHASTIKLNIVSSNTKFVDAVSVDDFRTFSSSTIDNRKRIVWTYQDGRINVKYGDSLASVGSMTLYFPAMPNAVLTVDDEIDLPDGFAVLCAIELLKTKILQRSGQPADVAGMIAKVSSLYAQQAKASGVEIETEAIEAKVKAVL